ncbi:MAG: 16S rRNA pseudouridine(516) synthase RsuA [Hahellaceae bacterium]|nr:16S rRNA pseudouridine(516) synthase RsuA [Hahellaceae bacterium]MCP5212623.1 16S rRNA pseudouridine(516) synthase RsuA [Hahellaceae bacterium]
MRLDKYICDCTTLSRIQAKRAIGKGDVTVSGVVVKKVSTPVTPGAEVVFEGRLLALRGPRYIMLHKPLDTVCTSLDDDPRSVLALLDVDKPEQLHIAGRLDVDTTGLVLITDDGNWSHRITSPKKTCGKRYRVKLAEPVDEGVINVFAQGVMLKDETRVTLPAQLEILTPQEVLLTLREGKYHQVKRMFAAMGNRVVGLHREQIGEIALDPSLEEGEWRPLTSQEVASVV